jgi:hypothetical protein
MVSLPLFGRDKNLIERIDWAAWNPNPIECHQPVSCGLRAKNIREEKYQLRAHPDAMGSEISTTHVPASGGGFGESSSMSRDSRASATKRIVSACRAIIDITILIAGQNCFALSWASVNATPRRLSGYAIARSGGDPDLT